MTRITWLQIFESALEVGINLNLHIRVRCTIQRVLLATNTSSHIKWLIQIPLLISHDSNLESPDLSEIKIRRFHRIVSSVRTVLRSIQWYKIWRDFRWWYLTFICKPLLTSPARDCVVQSINKTMKRARNESPYMQAHGKGLGRRLGPVRNR